MLRQWKQKLGGASEANSAPRTCAAPGCSAEENIEGEGKLFFVHASVPSRKELVIKSVWLCENCRESWDVTASADGETLLTPRERMAA